MKYVNPFYSEKYQGSNSHYDTDGYQLLEYNDFKISKRSNNEFHIIKNGVCLAMRAGLNGAKEFINKK